MANKRKKNSHINNMPTNLTNLIKQNEKRRDKEIEKVKEELETIKLITNHTLSASQNVLNLLTNFVSHDIKNEIHSIDSIISTISEDDIQSVKSCLDSMRDALDDFKNITNNKEKEIFSLGRLVSSLMVLHRNNFKSKKIKFDVEYINLDKNFIIHYNFRHFLQLFNNMLMNSYKALKTVEYKEIKLIIHNFDKFLSFKICDTGVGISSENKEKIFKPYFTTTKGSRIGLTHVSHVLNKISGTIMIEKANLPYKTIFNIQIPKS